MPFFTGLTDGKEPCIDIYSFLAQELQEAALEKSRQGGEDDIRYQRNLQMELQHVQTQLRMSHKVRYSRALGVPIMGQYLTVNHVGTVVF